MGLVWLRGQTAIIYVTSLLRPADNRDTLRRVWRKTLILKYNEEFRQNQIFKWINGNERRAVAVRNLSSVSEKKNLPDVSVSDIHIFL